MMTTAQIFSFIMEQFEQVGVLQDLFVSFFVLLLGIASLLLVPVICRKMRLKEAFNQRLNNLYRMATMRRLFPVKRE